MVRVPAMRTLENALRRVGFCYVAGVDEVGRGCLAGPVVAGAVVLHPDRHTPGGGGCRPCGPLPRPPRPGFLATRWGAARGRDRLFELITGEAVAWAVASA